MHKARALHSLTQPLICIRRIRMLQVRRYSLVSVKGGRIARRESQSVGLGEEMLASLQVLQPQPFDVGCEEPQLAPAAMGMAVEAADECFEVVVGGEGRKPRVHPHHLAKLAPNVVPCGDFT
jgi:hypothetical protein